MVSAKQAVFYLDNERYGIDIMEVNTIEKSIEVEKAIDAPMNIKGVIRLRGEVIPVYSLRNKFGLDEMPTDRETRLLITNTNGIQVAFEVDRMYGIANTESGQLFEIPSILKSRETVYMKNIMNLDGQLIVLLDKDNILTAEEEESLRKIQKA